MTGCQKPSGQWEALRDVPVFKDANDADELKYVVKKGEVCALGKERIAKEYMYREIRCDQGEGWIAKESQYPFKERS